MTKLNLFDHYSLHARLQPALLTLLPGALAVFAWTGPGDKWMSALWTLLGTAGSTYFLAVLARNQGWQLQSELWKSWGGAPTTQLLRHSGPANPVTRERWHKYLSKLLERPFPTAEAEAAAPADADNVYEAAVRLLITKTRDQKKFPLVYKENVLYGFCRNLYGMKATGIIVSLLGIMFSCAAGLWSVRLVGKPQIAPWVCTAISTLFLIWWIGSIKPEMVRVPAFAYAERLLESTEILSSSRRINTTSKD